MRRLYPPSQRATTRTHPTPNANQAAARGPKGPPRRCAPRPAGSSTGVEGTRGTLGE